MSGWPPLFAPGRRQHFAVVVACGLGQAIAAGATALLIRHTFDSLLRSEGPVPLTEAVLAGVGFALAGAAIYGLRIVERGAAEAMAQDYIAQLRQRIFRRVVNADYRAIRRKRRGHLMVRFVGDLGAVRGWIANGVSKITVAAIVLPIVTAVLMTIHAKIVAVVAAMLMCSFVAIFVARHSLRARHATARENKGKMAGELGEKLTSATVVDAFGQARREQRRLAARSRDVIDASVRRRRHSTMVVGIPDFAASFALAVIIIMGAAEIARGTATPGAVIAILTTLSLLVTPLKELASVFDRWRNFSVAREKIGNLLAIRQLKSGPRKGAALAKGNGRLQFTDARIDPVLHQFSADVRPKELVAITGANGSGKTTLLLAAAGLIDVDGGGISLDGSNFFETKQKHLRQAIGVCSAEIPLLRGTLRRNITYRRPRLSEDALDDIIAVCGLSELLNLLPAGLDTRISEGGGELSAGWRARVQLARAVAGTPRLLLLDEPDLGLDEAGFRTLLDLLAQRRQTTLIATKSLAILTMADQLWDLTDGTIEIKSASNPSSVNESTHLRAVADI